MSTFTERLELIIGATTGTATSEVKKLDAQIASAGLTTEGFHGQLNRVSQFLQNNWKLAATGGAVLLGMLAKQGVDAMNSYEELARSVKDFTEITMTSADEGSRWVAVSKQYGIGADTISKSMGMMEKNFTTNQEALQHYGIELIRNKNGQMDVNKTFLNAIDVLHNMGDANERATAAQKLFGKGWQSMTDLIDRGATEITADMKSVAGTQMISDAQIAKQKELDKTMADLSQRAAVLRLSIGESLATDLLRTAKAMDVLAVASEKIPKLKLFGVDIGDQFKKAGSYMMPVIGQVQMARDGYNRFSSAVEENSKKQAANKENVDALAHAYDYLQTDLGVEDMEGLGDATKKTDDKVKDLTYSERDAAKAHADATAAIKDEYDAANRLADAADEVANSQEKLASTQRAIADARDEIGQLTGKITRDQADLKAATADVATATKGQATATTEKSKADKLASNATDNLTKATDALAASRDAENKLNDEAEMIRREQTDGIISEADATARLEQNRRQQYDQAVRTREAERQVQIARDALTAANQRASIADNALKETQNQLKDAQDRQKTATDDLTTATQRRAAVMLTLPGLERDAEKAARNNAQAIAEQAAQQGGLKSASDNTVGSTWNQIASLNALRDTLAPGSPLRVWMDGYIQQLQRQLDVSRQLALNAQVQSPSQQSIYAPAIPGGKVGAGTGLRIFDEGGIVPGSGPMAAIVHGGEAVLNQAQQAQVARALAGQASGSGDVYIIQVSTLKPDAAAGQAIVDSINVYRRKGGRQVWMAN